MMNSIRPKGFNWMFNQMFNPDLMEDSKDKELRFIIPGVKKEDIKLTMNNTVVELRAGNLHIIQSLPIGVDIKSAKAIYENGILTVSFDNAKEDKIDIPIV